MMTDIGRSLTGRATRASTEPQEGLGHSASVPNALISVPRDAPEDMWDGLPRALMMWLSFPHPTPRALFNHLRCSGHDVPLWMREESELKALDHVPSKGTRCVLIYRAMVENWLAKCAASEAVTEAMLQAAYRATGCPVSEQGPGARNRHFFTEIYLAMRAASAIEAPSGVETGNTDSTEGESAVPNGETPK